MQKLMHRTVPKDDTPVGGQKTCCQIIGSYAPDLGEVSIEVPRLVCAVSLLMIKRTARRLTCKELCTRHGKRKSQAPHVWQLGTLSIRSCIAQKIDSKFG